MAAGQIPNLTSMGFDSSISCEWFPGMPTEATGVRGISSSGRAPVLQAGGGRFKSDILHD